jgi:RNA polymerase sigma factor (sigma-70 family)
MTTKPSLQTDEQIAELVQENFTWAESIARSVARAWNLDWQLDGLDGGAYEALLFCARRFDPAFGVPFRAYARKRIHESATEEARKSKAWQKCVGTDSPAEQEAREISFTLFELFPELREGIFPQNDETPGEDGIRMTIRELLSSASLVSAFRESGKHNQENAFEYKQMLETLAELEPVHQSVMWSLYWEGLSMRSLAEEWEIDELTIVREHREIVKHLADRITNPKKKITQKLKVRPSLRTVAQQLKKKQTDVPFARFTQSAAAVALMICLKTFLLESHFGGFVW